MIHSPQRKRRTARIGRVLLPSGILVLLATGVRADDFESRCEALARNARVAALFQDTTVAQDNSRSVAELTGMAGTPDPNHHVLGLTHAEPTLAVALAPRLLGGDGRVCAAPDLTLRLAFKDLRVYLARELADPCRRSAVYLHEQEHVAAWRDHFRVGARLLEAPLREIAAQPYYLETADADQLRKQVEARLAPLLQRLKEGAAAAQKEIDSPASYRQVEERLHACP